MFGACLLSACAGDEGLLVLPEARAVPFAPADVGPTAFGAVPFPSDLYLDEAGGVGEVPGLERVFGDPEIILAGLRSLDGFGRSTGALFFVEMEIDAGSLPRSWEDAVSPEASVLIVDVDERSLRLGTRYPAVARYLPSVGCVSVLPAPGVVLPPKTRHAVVLTKRVTSGGVALSANETLARIGASAPAERVSAAERLYGAALDQLVAKGAVSEKPEVASLAVFTTSDRAAELFRLRDALRSEPEPTLILEPEAAAPYSVAVFGVATSPSLDDWLGAPERDEEGREWPGMDNPGGIAHDALGVVASGAFVAPRWLDPATHHFERDGAGEYRIADAGATIPVTLMLPKAPPPARGYPVVIHGHGLSNNRGGVLGMANELARAGFAVIGIDDVRHGARGGNTDLKNNAKGPYQGPDGLPDDMPFPLSFFADFSDFVAVRDNFRQTVLDQSSLVRLIQSSRLDLSPLAAPAGGIVPKLDPTRIYWSGGSLGGIVGTMTVAVEPELRAAAFQVPGASFVQLITTGSAKLSGLVTKLVLGIFHPVGDEVTDEFHPLAHFLAQITEAGDPIAYAGNVLREPVGGRTPPDVMITYALDDEVLPNTATVALLRALGVELATPSLVAVPGVGSVAAPVSGNVAGRTAAAMQYAPANHGLGYTRRDSRAYAPSVDGDGAPTLARLAKSFQVEMPIREHSDQLVRFFTTAGEGHAVVEVTAPPRADIDGDGALDAEDASPYDPSVK